MVAGVGPGIDTSGCGCRYGCGCGCRVRVSGAAPVRDLDRHGNGSRNGGEGRETKLLRGEQSRGRNIQLFMPAAPYHAYIVSAGHTYTWLLNPQQHYQLGSGGRESFISLCSITLPSWHRWETSLAHVTRTATEAKTRDTQEWTASHVRPGRRHRPPKGKGLRRKLLRRTRKPLTGRHYQLLSGRAAIYRDISYGWDGGFTAQAAFVAGGFPPIKEEEYPPCGVLGLRPEPCARKC